MRAEEEVTDSTITLPGLHTRYNMRLRIIRSRILPAEQHCKGAPWVIRSEDLENPDVGDRANASRKRPLTSNPDQQILVFQ